MSARSLTRAQVRQGLVALLSGLRVVDSDDATWRESAWSGGALQLEHEGRPWVHGTYSLDHVGTVPGDAVALTRRRTGGAQVRSSYRLTLVMRCRADAQTSDLDAMCDAEAHVVACLVQRAHDSQHVYVRRIDGPVPLEGSIAALQILIDVDHLLL